MKKQITLAHGDGGVVTSRFIKEEILSRFSNPVLDQLEDGSVIDCEGQQAVVSTDSYIVDPIFFPNGDIGKLAATGTINDVLAAGAIPKYLTLGLIIAEGFPISDLTSILDSIKAVTDQTGVSVICGDTKVLRLSTPQSMFINTTGIGFPIIDGNTHFPLSGAKPKDTLIITGHIGDHGFSILSMREGLGFENRIVSDCAPLTDLMVPVIQEFHKSIRCLRDPTRGGLLGALFDLVEKSQVDVLLEHENIPIREEVNFGCEMLGIDPLNLVNEGKMLLVVDGEKAEAILQQLRQHPDGKHSAVIGEVLPPQASKPGRVILNKGNTRQWIPPVKHLPIPRLC